MRKILFAIFASFILLFSLAPLSAPVFAEEKLKGNDCLEGGVVTIDCVPIIFANLVYWAIILSGTVAVIFVIFGGFKLLTSGGDPKQIEAARKTVTWALIGLFLVLLSFAIVSFIANITGVSCLTKFGFRCT